MIQISLLRSYKRVPHQFRCFRPATTRRYKSTIIDILKPIVVEDDDAVVDGDGSNAYQNKEETRERWEVPRVPVMDISIDGMSSPNLCGVACIKSCQPPRRHQIPSNIKATVGPVFGVVLRD